MLAASSEAARLAGRCEVLERDTIMLAWLYGLELPRLHPPKSMSGIMALLQSFLLFGSCFL